MTEVRAYAPTGMLGSGYAEASLKRAMEWEPHFIGCDAGSTDPGPAHLGAGICQFSRPAVKRDLRLMLLAARQASIPLLVGSCGTGGGDLNLAWAMDILREVAREEGLRFRAAVIHSEQDRAYLKGKLAEEKIRPLKPAPPISEGTLERSDHIVGMMGAEPLASALGQGAEVVMAGRCSDTSVFAAVPVHHGLPPAPVWHAAKILECGAAAVTQRKSPDGMFAWIRDDHFVVAPPNPELRCSPQSVASHTLYENADPFHLYEPGGMLDTEDARYEPVDDRSVRVSGSRFVPAERYSIKLEGAELVGYGSVVVGGVRDPVILRQLGSWLDGIQGRVAQRVREAFDGLEMGRDYQYHVRKYGVDGVMGTLEPMRQPASHEACLLFEVTARDQGLARNIADSVHHIALHYAVPEWHGLISALAFPYSPPTLDLGPVHRFTLNHVVEPADPFEMFRTELVEV